MVKAWQHEDGHSVLLAATNPAAVHYDARYAFELPHIVRDGLRRMYGDEPENVFYYLTIYNEPYAAYRAGEPRCRRAAEGRTGSALTSPTATTLRGRRFWPPALR